MDAFEKIIKTIRNEADRNKTKYPFKIGVMKSKNTCKVGGLTLDEDDILVCERVDGELKKDDEVLICQVSDEHFVIVDKVVEI